jgi:diguanylate cyclase (GGDEF)-like protein
VVEDQQVGWREDVDAYAAVPMASRLWTVLLVGAAAVVPPALGTTVPLQDLGFAVVLVLLAGLNVELGRAAEGGHVVHRQRPHKALSAWPYAAALLVAPVLLPLVVGASYAWTRWRGLRVDLHKWIGSGAILVLAGCAVSVAGPEPSPLGVVAGAALFLVVEVSLLGVCALLGDPAGEAWLRGQLRSRSFHLGEAGVLLSGAAVALLWWLDPWFVLLTVPTFVALQRAVLVEPLRTEARTDEKTGLLHYAAWRRSAEEAAAAGPVAVLFADLDHFKAVNDTHGHLVGDEVLAEVAARLLAVLRSGDVAGRFGGEEFCVLLPGAGTSEALAVAERLRQAVRTTPMAGFPVTVSVGVGVGVDSRPASLGALMAAADRAVYAAKDAGRDVTRVEVVGVVPAPRGDRVRV